MDIAKVKAVAEENLTGDLFLVSVKSTPSNEIEVVIDSDTRVSIEQCIVLSKAIEGTFDREVEDYELTVISSGIGQPLELLRQYQKVMGRPVEVLLKSGIKVRGELVAATDESISVKYATKMAVEGKKRKELVEITESYLMSDIKSTKEELDIK